MKRHAPHAFLLGAVPLAATFAFALGGVACDGETVDPGGDPPVEVPADDPLRIERTFEAGSLDDIFDRIIRPSCAGQEGLCHNGQFEPNLSTPALVFETMVARPSLERRQNERVVPGAPQKSLLVDKLRNRDVISRMPLGASALSEEDIATIERWIERGAKRREGDGPLPVVDNPPSPPLFGVFDADGTRLDPADGVAVVKVGDTVDLRMSTNDFEVPDVEVPAAFFLLQTTMSESAIIGPPDDPNLATLGLASFDDASPPEEQGERLNWSFQLTIPATIDIVGVDGKTRTIETAGETFNILSAYYDKLPQDDGLLGLSFRANALRVEAAGGAQ